MDRSAFQRVLDALADGAALDMHAQTYPRELEGPLHVTHRAVIDGKGATLWARRGPVLTVKADRVELRNLIIEVTDSEDATVGEDACALVVPRGCKVKIENVVLRGAVTGLPDEDGMWQYPQSLNLDRVAHRMEHSFLIRIVTPVPCKVQSGVTGIEVLPHQLKAGRNEVQLIVDESIPRDTLLHGPLELITPRFKRRIILNGHVLVPDGSWGPLDDTSPQRVLWEPKDWLTPVPAPAVDRQPETQAVPVVADSPPVSPAPRPADVDAASPHRSPPGVPPRYPEAQAEAPSPPAQPPLPPPTPPSVPLVSAEPGLPKLTSTRIVYTSGPQLGGAFQNSSSAGAAAVFVDGTQIDATRVYVARHGADRQDRIRWLLVNECTGKLVHADSIGGRLAAPLTGGQAPNRSDPAGWTEDLPAGEKAWADRFGQSHDPVLNRNDWPAFVRPIDPPIRDVTPAERRRLTISPVFGGPGGEKSHPASPPTQPPAPAEPAGGGTTSPAAPVRKTTRRASLPPIFGGNEGAKS